MFTLVLGFAGAQGFRQVVPELEQPIVEHDQHSADIARARLVEIESSRWRVEVLRLRSVPFPLQEVHRHQRVEEIAERAGVQAKLPAQLGAAKPASSEFGEESEIDCRQQDLR